MNLRREGNGNMNMYENEKERSISAQAILFDRSRISKIFDFLKTLNVCKVTV